MSRFATTCLILLTALFSAVALCGTAYPAHADDTPDMFTQMGHSAPVHSVAYSHDGTRVLSGSGDNTMKLWDAASGREMITFSGHTSEIESVAFSPDDSQVVSCGID